MIEGKLNAHPPSDGSRNPKSHYKNGGRVQNKEKDEKKNLMKNDNINISIDLKKKANMECIYNYNSKFSDEKHSDNNQTDAFTNKKERILNETQLVNSGVQDDFILENMEDSCDKEEHNIRIMEVKNCNAKKNILKILYIRLLYAIIFIILSILIQCYFIILSDTYYNMGDEPLKDRIHEMYKEAPLFMNAEFINGNILFFLIITLLRFGFFSPFILAISMFIRLTLMLSFIYFIRSIFIYVTTIPCPIATCQPLRNKNILENLYSAYLIITAQVYECTDLIISGHTAFTTVLKLFWMFYEKKLFIKTILFFYCLFIYAMIVISKFHYTVDVLMGYVFGSTVFIFYHTLLEIAAKRYARHRSFSIRSSNYASSFVERCSLFNCFIRVIGYLEGLDHRLNMAISFNKEWECFCSCKPVNAQGLIVKKTTVVNNEEYFDFSDHFYHSYAGSGTFDSSTVKNILNEIKYLCGIRKKN
ncbi:sphingomyelin synthase 1 [Plasmodium gonderi]|uniref:Sphingomyelin synthase 1 n=1 Tax=Plasmodium gonderi TaxID=77519 RepID=A0A1Y1JGY8_PLAGO|nr:sphingomyelin synthase 1 [Plasmodium gonderi]GAW81781.1 sphingomyelin synthase 1 [Plasmodium gonderi]